MISCAKHRWTVNWAILIALTAVTHATGADSEAQRILAASGIKGGLVVHVGCGDGALTTELRSSESYVVHGLDTDPARVAAARQAILKRGVNGPVAVDGFDGKHLPYIDNLVSLLVSENLGEVTKEEALRVLRPRGVAYVKEKGEWTRTVKPVPDGIDEWPHYLHGADNNAVARDTVVGPPRRMQWVAGPAFARSHEINSSLAAMVSAGSRLFYIWDDGPTAVTDKRFPAKWKLIARDAFNGVVLWKRPMPKWGWRQWHVASRWDDQRERAKMLRYLPATLPRRLVASGDRVYVTLGYNAPVTELDAATGKVLRELEGTALTDEILVVDGTLILRTRVQGSPPEKDVWGKMPNRARARVTAIGIKDGKQLWQSKAGTMGPLTLAARDGRVFYYDYERIVCLDRKSGKEVWRSPKVDGSVGGRGTVGTLVAQDKVVLFAPYPWGKKTGGRQRLHALSAETGEVLWRGTPYIGPGISNPPDLFVAGGCVWTGETKLPVSHQQIELRRQGLDPVTGKVTREIVVPKLISWGHHYRCYRSKATERFLMLPKRGIEFVDLKGKDHARHDWLRAPCIYGIMPANGMLYVPPHQCVCYQGVLLSNFNVLAPKAADGVAMPAPAERLRKGPAWGKLDSDVRVAEGEWPTYRHNHLRSGVARTAAPENLETRWRVKLPGRLTPPVVAGGRLLVAERDAHTVHALEADTGKTLWTFTAGGRVDSPPTVHENLVLFGCADGRAYGLRLEDGQEVWRFLAAPFQRNVVAFGQVESAWPVHGSVLVQRDATVDPPREVAYFTAGRSSFLDGGIRVYGLDPQTGKVLHQNVLHGPHPNPFKKKGGAGYMDGSKSDILVGDGADIFLFQERFSSDLKRWPAPMQKPAKEYGGFRVYPAAPDRGSTGKHLITTHGFLTVAENEGKYWTYGNRWPGWDRKMRNVPAFGQLLVFSKKTIYGVNTYTENVRVRRGRTLGKKGPRIFARKHGAKKDAWSVHVPINVRAMVLAGGKLFLAGPPDAIPADDPLAAIEGRKGGMLWSLSAKDGKKTETCRLDASPVFDGMIAASGRIYVSDLSGHIRCIGK